MLSMSSPLMRGAWIETAEYIWRARMMPSPLMRGAWIETVRNVVRGWWTNESPLMRGAWIETSQG